MGQSWRKMNELEDNTQHLDNNTQHLDNNTEGKIDGKYREEHMKHII